MSFDWIGMLGQASAQDRATEANRQNMKDTNRVNLIMSLMARGQPLSKAAAAELGIPGMAGKSSAILPYYLSDIEKSTGMRAGQLATAIQTMGGTPAQQLKKAENDIKQFGPAQAQANAIGASVLSGQMTQQRLAEEAPVGQARLDIATTERNAALTELDRTLNDIDAIQAKKGYSGDSYGNRVLKANARLNVMGSTAGETAKAKLANEQEKFGIKESGRQMQLSNLDLPTRLATSTGELSNLPSQIVGQRFAAGMQPLSYFNIGNHPFQQQGLPTEDYTSKWGLALSGLGAGANSALNYALQRTLQSGYNNYGYHPLTTAELTPTTYGAFQGGGGGAPPPPPPPPAEGGAGGWTGGEM